MFVHRPFLRHLITAVGTVTALTMLPPPSAAQSTDAWQNPYSDVKQIQRLCGTVTCDDGVLRRNAEKFQAVIGPVISVRKDATDGTGAPQIGLDPDYPRSLPTWIGFTTKYPDAAKQLDKCVAKYIQATNEIKQIAPLTRRPAWDTSGPQIDAGLKRASADIQAGDRCVKQTADNWDMAGTIKEMAGIASLIPPPRGSPRDGPVGNPPPSRPSNGSTPPVSSSTAGTNACRPFGSGGYDYCANPVGGPLPAGCVCDGTARINGASGSGASSPRNTSGGAINSPSPLVQLSDFLNNIAPHYDMRRPHEGLRILTGILIAMGSGYLIQGIPVGWRALFGKAAGDAMEEAATASGRVLGDAGGSIVGRALSWKDLPAKLIPNVLRSTPRPIYSQQTEYSCGEACVKMVAQTVKRQSLPESFYRQVTRGAWGSVPGGYTPGVGTDVARIAYALRLAGVRTTELSQQTIDDLARATQNGYPAIVGVGTKQGHAVIVDAVVGPPGSRYVLVRDPMNLALVDDVSRKFLQEAGFDNYIAYEESVFAREFAGVAIYTMP